MIFAKFCKKHDIKNTKKNIIIKLIIAKLIVLLIDLFNRTHISKYIRKYKFVELNRKFVVDLIILIFF